MAFIMLLGTAKNPSDLKVADIIPLNVNTFIIVSIRYENIFLPFFSQKKKKTENFGS